MVFAAFASRRREIPVHAVRTSRSVIMAAIDTDGRVEALDNFEAHAPAPATVKKVFVHQGQMVKAGELLLRLDDADARVQLARAMAQVRTAELELATLQAGGSREEVLTSQSQLATAKAEQAAASRNLESLRRLQQQGAASPAEVREMEGRLAAAKAQAELLEKKLASRYSESDVRRAQAQLEEARAASSAAQELIRSTNIQAPRAGTVYSLPARENQFVNAGDVLVQVARLDPVQVRAFVDEPEIGRLRQNQQVMIRWNALPNREWEGHITQVPTTVVMRGTRTVGEVTTLIGNGDLLLLPNVNVSISIVTEKTKGAITLPREAVRGEGSNRYVFVVQSGKLHKQAVETGTSNLTQIQISKGLSEGEEVATTTLTGASLLDGMDVKVAEQ
jgi:HlyD family secretion protein